MGAMGRYIAALTDEGRDRLIRAHGWCSWVLLDGRGGGCLRGNAEIVDHTAFALHSDQRGAAEMCRAIKYQAAPKIHPRLPASEVEGIAAPWLAFNLAYDRWPERTVRAIKLRAAKLNGTTSEQIAELTSARRVEVAS
jgi:hypothetical protein